MPYEEVYGTSFEDMQRRVPDLTKIHSYVGYAPSVKLDELLQMTIESVSNELREEANAEILPAAARIDH